MPLNYIYRKFTTPPNVGIEIAASLASSELNERNVIVQEGVSFETLVPERVLAIPENKPIAETSVKFGIRITNRAEKPIRFSRFDAFYPNILRPDGKILQLDGGRNGSLNLKKSDFPLVMPGESVMFFLEGKLSWQNNKLELGGSDGFGGFWYFHDIKPGNYQVRFIYQNYEVVRRIYEPEEQVLEGIWTGQVATSFVELSIIKH